MLALSQIQRSYSLIVAHVELPENIFKILSSDPNSTHRRDVSKAKLFSIFTLATRKI